jgi:sigma-B regulation protein RsbU (phosphoserine phosphatase)
VPLPADNEVIGLIYVDSRSFGRRFADADLILLSVFANVAAIRIDRERHLELRQQEEFRTRDLQQAAEIQRGILPGRPPTLDGLDLAGHNAPCQTVGGDFYDFIPYADGRLGLVLADVAGKGMAAAMLVSNLQACVRLLTEEPPGLATLVARLNKSMAARCPANRFITLFMIVVDPRTGEATYCNAGHNPALIVRATGEVEELKAVGVVLGFLPDVVYEEHPARLAEGDMLVLYSDGITEATDADTTQFGEERFKEILVARRNDTAADIVAAVVSAVAAWCPSDVADDDITIIVARRR